MIKRKIILLGGGGHCRSCIDVIESTGVFQIVGILDVAEKKDEDVLGYKIIGDDEDIPSFVAKGIGFMITAGHVKSCIVRRKLYDLVKASKGFLETVVASTAHVSIHAKLGEGSIIMHHAVVNANARVGSNCILNTGSILEHDGVIGDHVHLSTMAVVNGGCLIGTGSFVGSNAVVNEGVSIASDVVIGAGSVVNKSIMEIGIFAGNPFKKIS